MSQKFETQGCQWCGVQRIKSTLADRGNNETWFAAPLLFQVILGFSIKPISSTISSKKIGFTQRSLLLSVYLNRIFKLTNLLYSLYYAEACNRSHLRVIAPRQHSFDLSRKCCSGGEPLATLYSIWPALDLNLRPPVAETNALPLAGN